MKTKLVRIGDSLGVRIPEALLVQLGFHDHVHVKVEHGRLVIRASTPPRGGWDDAFRRMRQRGEDAVLDEDSVPITKWDTTEWNW